MADAPVIDIRNLTLRYGRSEILHDITWQVDPGHVVGLLGRNGAGKSTLLHAALGLLDAHRGTCTLLGEDAPNCSDAVKERLGFVPQSPQMPGWTAVHRLITHHRSFYPRWDERLVERLIDRFGIDPGKRVSSLSLGQQQALSLILALAPQPDLLVLDEPAASLDPVARRVFQEVVLEVVMDGRRSVVLSSHLTSDIERVCDRVLVLKAGRTAFDGDLGELKASVKRIQVIANVVLPLRLTMPGLLAWEVSGTVGTATVQGDDPMAAIRMAFPDAELSLQDLPLEDLLVEMHR